MMMNKNFLILFLLFNASINCFASFPVQNIEKDINENRISNNLNSNLLVLPNSGILSNLSAWDKIESILLALSVFGIVGIFIKCFLDGKWSRLLMIPIAFLLLIVFVAALILVEDNDQWFTHF
jgi:hypothetical protein